MGSFAERLAAQKNAMAGGSQQQTTPVNPFASAPPPTTQTTQQAQPSNPFGGAPAVAGVVNPPGEAAPEELDQTPEDPPNEETTDAPDPGKRKKKPATKAKAEIEELEARTVLWKALTVWIGRQK